MKLLQKPDSKLQINQNIAYKNNFKASLVEVFTLNPLGIASLHLYMFGRKDSIRTQMHRLRSGTEKSLSCVIGVCGIVPIHWDPE